MDPTACLRRIETAQTVTDGVDACNDLQTWLSAGGFQPEWSAYPKGAAAFKRWRQRSKIVLPRIHA